MPSPAGSSGGWGWGSSGLTRFMITIGRNIQSFSHRGIWKGWFWYPSPSTSPFPWTAKFSISCFFAFGNIARCPLPCGFSAPIENPKSTVLFLRYILVFAQFKCQDHSYMWSSIILNRLLLGFQTQVSKRQRHPTSSMERTCSSQSLSIPSKVSNEAVFHYQSCQDSK